MQNFGDAVGEIMMGSGIFLGVKCCAAAGIDVITRVLPKMPCSSPFLPATRYHPALYITKPGLRETAMHPACCCHRPGRMFMARQQSKFHGLPFPSTKDTVGLPESLQPQK